MKYAFLVLLFTFPVAHTYSWGFFAHKEINKLAVFTLPPEMFGFYKNNIDLMILGAVHPDKRRYSDPEEGARHFIDLDVYENNIDSLPQDWKEAIKVYDEDSLKVHGIVPWHIYLMKFRLTEAFRRKDFPEIITLSAEIGHYIADAHVPLHTTRNYNGQFTNQHGIHGLWESRLPELFSIEYNFFVGKASYIKDVKSAVWNAVYQAHSAVDSVLAFEKNLNNKFDEDKKYAFEERNNNTVKVYSKEYGQAYHHLLHHQVERQMQHSIKMIGDILYTCWVDAGQPDLSHSDSVEVLTEDKKQSEEQHMTDCLH